MYLSRLMFTVRDRRAWRMLENPYRTHAAVLRGVPDQEPERVLFRVEPMRDPGMARATVLVQSQSPPDWQALAGELESAFQSEWRPFDPVFAGEERLHFRLRANPTVKRDGTRIPLVGDEAVLGWLERKGRTAGFTFDPAQVLARDEGTWRRNREGGPIVIRTVLFEGRLTVQDPEAFAAAVRQGIGPAKGFGCGLLSVRRLAAPRDASCSTP